MPIVTSTHSHTNKYSLTQTQTYTHYPTFPHKHTPHCPTHPLSHLCMLLRVRLLIALSISPCCSPPPARADDEVELKSDSGNCVVVGGEVVGGGSTVVDVHMCAVEGCTCRLEGCTCTNSSAGTCMGRSPLPREAEAMIGSLFSSHENASSSSSSSSSTWLEKGSSTVSKLLA